MVSFYYFFLAIPPIKYVELHKNTLQSKATLRIDTMGFCNKPILKKGREKRI